MKGVTTAGAIHLAPQHAYRRPDVYHSGVDFAPKNDYDYREYHFVGRLLVELEEDGRTAAARAKERFGKPKAQVFRSGKYWVVFEVK